MTVLARFAAIAPLVLTSALGAQEGGFASFLDTVEVRVVNVDVVVLGPDGEPWLGLEREDFELLEDGRPVEISYFAAYQAAADVDVDGAGTAVGTDASLPPAETSPSAAPPATWIVYVDQSRLEPGPRAEIVREAREFLAGALAPGDRALVATFDGVSLKLLSPVTTEPGRALSALERLERQVGFPSSLRGQASRIRAEIANFDPSAPSAEADAEDILASIESASREEALRARSALDAVGDLLSIVAGAEGRTALLFAGGGFESDPSESLYRLFEARLGSFVTDRSRLSRELDAEVQEIRSRFTDMLRAVNASRVTVYSIYAGAGRTAGVSAEIGGDPGASGPSLAVGSSPEGGSTLAAFATETGGRSFVGAPDLAARLVAARDDLRTYYSLGYEPPRRDDADGGGLREIEVRVRREGARAIHRRGVTERTQRELAGDAAIAALIAAQAAPAPAGAALEVGTPERARGKTRRLPVVVRLPLAAVTLVPDGAVHRARLELHFALAAPDGGYRRLEARPFAFSVPNEKLAAALGQSASFEVELALEPGDYEIAVAVYDEIGGERWTLRAAAPISAAR